MTAASKPSLSTELQGIAMKGTEAMLSGAIQKKPHIQSNPRSNKTILAQIGAERRFFPCDSSNPNWKGLPPKNL